MSAMSWPRTKLEKLALWRRLIDRSVYVIAGFPIGVARFVVLMPLFVVGLATLPIGAGFPILTLTMTIAGWFARIDRERLSRIQGRRAVPPAYKNRRGGYRRFLDTLSDPQSWRDFTHGVVMLPVGYIGFVVGIAWWTTVLLGLTSVLYAWAIPGGIEGLADLLGYSDPLADVVVNTGIGLICVLTLPVVMRALSAMCEGPTRALLTTERVAELSEQVSDLSESRDAAASAEAAALRKLERDIHDGPQQRLVRLAMDLSTAQRRMDTDPDAARPLLDEALAQARDTLDELRALSRGIAPPILADRGLAAAVAALAARSPIPVDIDVALPAGSRLPEQVENAAYFVVAESLTNVVKHSGASRCTVSVTRNGALVHVLVSDDGVGGAHLAKGHGIAGLADRVRGIGGRLEVESPAGGPTIVSAELPCGS